MRSMPDLHLPEKLRGEVGGASSSNGLLYACDLLGD